LVAMGIAVWKVVDNSHKIAKQIDAFKNTNKHNCD